MVCSLKTDLSIKIVGIAYFNSKNVLDANTVTVEIALVGDAAGNYRLENGTVYLEGSIVPKGIDVVMSGSLDKTYDGTSVLIVPFRSPTVCRRRCRRHRRIL